MNSISLKKCISEVIQPVNLQDGRYAMNIHIRGSKVPCVLYSILWYVHVALTVNGFGIWSTFGDTVLYVCVPKYHGYVCSDDVMQSKSM